MSEGSISIDFFYMGSRFYQYKRENANLKRTKLGLALILGTSLIANNNGIPSRLSKSFPEKAFIKGAGVSLTISSHTSLISLICLSSPPTISYVESGTFSTIIKLTRGSTWKHRECSYRTKLKEIKQPATLLNSPQVQAHNWTTKISHPYQKTLSNLIGSKKLNFELPITMWMNTKNS